MIAASIWLLQLLLSTRRRLCQQTCVASAASLIKVNQYEVHVSYRVLQVCSGLGVREQTVQSQAGGDCRKVLNKVLRMEKVSPVSEVVKSCQPREGRDGDCWRAVASRAENMALILRVTFNCLPINLDTIRFLLPQAKLLIFTSLESLLELTLKW